jgi:hydrogenase nickel incorporation protein HypA/HybF
VELRVGHLRQVVPSALTFSFELVTQGTPLEGAVLDLEHVPAAGRCRTCGTETEFDAFPLQCGSCAGFDLELLRGEEFLVVALELDDEDDALTTTGGATSDGR